MAPSSEQTDQPRRNPDCNPDSASPQKSGRRRRWRYALFATVTVLVSTILAYYACEAVYRWTKFRQLQQFSQSQPDILTEVPVDRFNEQLGFAYAPNTQTRLRKYDAAGNLLIGDVQLRTNNLGHISNHDDSLEKPADEFRIALLGDSMTAALEMDEPWPDTLEQLLNADPHLKQRLGVARVNVINFAQEGIGVVQCGAIHEHRVTAYDADLVVLNFIDEDIPRRFVYRAPLRRELPGGSYYLTVHTYSLPCSPDNPNRFFGTVSTSFEDYDNLDFRLALMEDIALIRRGQIRWTSPFPELFAERGGHHIGLAPRIFRSLGHSHFNDDEAIRHCVAACRKIQQTSRRSLFLCMPGGPASGEALPPGQLPALTQRLAEDGGLEITAMSGYMPVDEVAVRSVNHPAWYIPGDGHLNDLGGKIYAAAMQRRLTELLCGG